MQKETTRQKKVAGLLQQELSNIFQKELRNILGNSTLVTITVVRVTPDLGLARVYLSFLPSANRTEKLERIRENGKAIRQWLAAAVRFQLRIIPNLEFFIDDTQDEVDKMNRLLNSLGIPPAKDSEEK
jgi:ribosome-binding factor A